MREILFRGKTQDGEWAYGIPVVLGGRTYILSDFRYGGAYIDKKVIGETVGQFTGLKDRHGKKIFEGDILRHKYGLTFNKLYTIVFDYGAFCFKTDRYITPLGDSEFGIVGSNCLIDDCEVIGNIHDNPELLEV